MRNEKDRPCKDQSDDQFFLGPNHLTMVNGKNGRTMPATTSEYFPQWGAWGGIASLPVIWSMPIRRNASPIAVKIEKRITIGSIGVNRISVFIGYLPQMVAPIHWKVKQEKDPRSFPEVMSFGEALEGLTKLSPVDVQQSLGPVG